MKICLFKRKKKQNPRSLSPDIHVVNCQKQKYQIYFLGTNEIVSNINASLWDDDSRLKYATRILGRKHDFAKGPEVILFM